VRDKEEREEEEEGREQRTVKEMMINAIAQGTVW
jgi:hypothetical protein